jgi:hypothetical protein
MNLCDEKAFIAKLANCRGTSIHSCFKQMDFLIIRRMGLRQGAGPELVGLIFAGPSGEKFSKTFESK